VRGVCQGEVAVATELAGDAAAELLARDADLTLADAADTGLYAAPETADTDPDSFTVLGAIAVDAVALNTTGEITEEQTRAATAFVDHSAQHHTPAEAALLPVDQHILAQATHPTTAPDDVDDTAPADPPEPDTPTEVEGHTRPTLLVLDTSTRMAENFDPAREEFAEIAAELTSQGQTVGIWNYSSPLNPGVNKGWRRNLTFTHNADAVSTVLWQLGTGGVPQTRSAATAAVAAAADQAQQTGQPTRVLLVTTGTDADLDDDSFRDQLDQARTDAVSLDVVHLGEAAVDPVLEEQADSFAQGLAALRPAAGI
ncbi:MAG TPA: hypothetical protein VFC72_07745, partial [Corynebacterium sp.]|nr:hypothetical protein [Corynebacterium sp.]